MRRSWLLAVAGIAALCSWCGWLSGFHRASTPAVVTWVVSLALVVAVDLLLVRLAAGPRSPLWLAPAKHGSVPETKHSRRLTPILPWLALALVMLVWDVLGLDTGGHEPHLTISALAQAFRPLDAALLLTWMLVGIGYGVTKARSRRAGGTGSHMTAQRAFVPSLLLPASRPAGLAFWFAASACALVIDQVARHSHSRIATAEQFLALVTENPVANVAVVLAWTYAGYHLFAR